MKKIAKKLALNKQTMALLDDKEMTKVKGGKTATWSCPPSWNTDCPSDDCN